MKWWIAAALIGGVAISSKWLGACHSLAHQLSSFADVQHGLANAIMLPHQMAYSLPGAIERALASGKPACVNVMIERVPAPVIRRNA